MLGLLGGRDLLERADTFSIVIVLRFVTIIESGHTGTSSFPLIGSHPCPPRPLLVSCIFQPCSDKCQGAIKFRLRNQLRFNNKWRHAEYEYDCGGVSSPPGGASPPPDRLTGPTSSTYVRGENH